MYFVQGQDINHESDHKSISHTLMSKHNNSSTSAQKNLFLFCKASCDCSDRNYNKITKITILSCSTVFFTATHKSKKLEKSSHINVMLTLKPIFKYHIIKIHFTLVCKIVTKLSQCVFPSHMTFNIHT